MEAAGVNNSRGIAFIDMDGTIFREESQLHFLWWCIRRGKVNPFSALAVGVLYLLYLCGVLKNAENLRRRGFLLFRGLNKPTLDGYTRDFLAGFSRRIQWGVLALLFSHRNRGHQLVLLTSAADVLAEKVAAILGIDHIIATCLCLERGAYTGEIVQPSPWGEGKRLLVERFCRAAGVDPVDCYVYADHDSDLPLMEWVGHPVAVNPDRRLRQQARLNGWRVIDLDSRLRRKNKSLNKG